MVAAHFHVSGVEPDIGPVAFERPIEEGFDPVVDLLAQPRHLALGDARAADRPDEVVDRAGRHALHIGLLNHRAQRLLGHPSRLEETRKVRALAQLRDAQLDRAGSRLPVPVAVAVALRQPVGRPLAVRRASPGATSSSISRSAAKAIMSRRMSASGAFSTSARRFIISSVIGCSSVRVCDSQPEPTEKPPHDRRNRSLATALWRARFASALLPPSYTTTRNTTAAIQSCRSGPSSPGLLPPGSQSPGAAMTSLVRPHHITL